MKTKKVLIAIPAYNEEDSIGLAIQTLRTTCPEYDYLIINDGSTDTTLSQAQKTGALIVNLHINIGIGGAVQTGFKYAYQNNYDIIVQFDGDNQHPAEQIDLLINTMQKEETDIVIGSRFLQKEGFKTTLLRTPGVHLLARLISSLIGIRVTDTTSGFRAFGRKAITLFAHTYPQSYPEPEVLLVAHKSGLTMVEVPVIMHERRTGVSSIGLSTSFHYMFTVLLNLIIGYFKYHKRKPNQC